MTLRNSVRSLEEFHDLVADGYYESDAYLVRKTSSPPEFKLNSITAGLISVARFAGIDVGVRREWKHIRARSSEVYVIWFPISGAVAITQDKTHEAIIEPGHFVMTYGDRPFHAKAISRGEGACEQIHITVPSHVMRTHIPRIDSFCGRGFSARSGSAKIARDLFSTMMEEADLLSSEVASKLALGGLEALATAIRDGLPEDLIHVDAKKTHLERVLRYIDQHLSTQGLTADRVATDCKVSRRYLHYLMRYHDTTFGEYLWARRLVQADEWLSDPEFSHFNIVDIAYMSGFRSASHFSSCYRARFGSPPSDKRIHAGASG